MSMSDAYIFHDCRFIRMQDSFKVLISNPPFWITSTVSTPVNQQGPWALLPSTCDKHGFHENQQQEVKKKKKKATFLCIRI